MQQLPGHQSPRWLQKLVAFVITVMATIWLVSLLPVLLLIGLVAGVMLVPVLRQLRQELERLERAEPSHWAPAASTLRDATPWTQRLRNRLRI
ncbi:MAG: hypothetical protein VKK03_01705 [Synechococcus sp.]|nr:hypothetical protein [Synechococcus sp.]